MTVVKVTAKNFIHKDIKKTVIINKFRISRTQFISAQNGTEEDYYINELLVRYLVKYWSRIRFHSFFQELEVVRVNINPAWADTDQYYRMKNGIEGIIIVPWDKMTENEEYDVLELGYILRHELYHIFLPERELSRDDFHLGWGLEFHISGRRWKNVRLLTDNMDRKIRCKEVDDIEVPKEFLLVQIADRYDQGRFLFDFEIDQETDSCASL